MENFAFIIHYRYAIASRAYLSQMRIHGGIIKADSGALSTQDVPQLRNFAQREYSALILNPPRRQSNVAIFIFSSKYMCTHS